MDIDVLLEAFQDFEKKGVKDVCPTLEQFLCHVAKTGQPLISWSKFKTYFMYKLEKVICDFNETDPEQRTLHNPNVDFVPFEEMKKRILKIVDGYSGTPFTIQRICELLMDPKRNYSSADKFLRGLEKNVMVVSCVYPTSDRNVNGPSTPKHHNRPKLSLSSSFSANGLLDSPAPKDPQHSGEASRSDCKTTQKGGTKHKIPQTADDRDGDRRPTKKLKTETKPEDELSCEKKDSSHHNGSERISETHESAGDSPGAECKSEPCCSTSLEEDLETEPSSGQTKTSKLKGESLEESSSIPEQSDNSPLGKNPIFEQESEESCSSSTSSSSSSSDGEVSTSDKHVSSSSTSPDMSAEGSCDILYTSEPEEHH